MQNPSESYFPPQWASAPQHTVVPPHPEEMERRRHRASTAPPSQFAATTNGRPLSLHPRTLTPGLHATAPQRHDLFFQQSPYSPSFPSPQFPPPLPPMPPQLASNLSGGGMDLTYSANHLSGYAPSEPSVSPPPLPPKVPHLPPSLVPARRPMSSMGLSSSPHSSSSPPPIPPLPESFQRRLSYAPPPPPPVPLRPEVPPPFPPQTFDVKESPLPPPLPPLPREEAEVVTETPSVEPSKLPGEEDELAAVLAISQSESDQREEWRVREEEELAKALEQSLLAAPGQTFTFAASAPPIASTSKLPPPPPQDLPSLRSANLYDFANLKGHSDPWQSPPSTSHSQLPDDTSRPKAVDPESSKSYGKARDSPKNRRVSLSVVEEERDLPEYVSRSEFRQAAEKSALFTPAPHSISADEEFARRLAEEEEEEYERAKRGAPAASPTQVPSDLPLYSPAKVSQPLPTAKAEKSAIANQGSEPSYQAALVASPLVESAPPIYSPPSRNSSASVTLKTPLDGQDSARSSIATNVTDYFPSSATSESDADSLPAKSPLSQGKLDGKVRLSVIDMDTETKVPGTAAAAPAGVINPNHFIDAQLLLGVSVGFVPPTLSTQLLPMSIPMPNVIDLPYGKYPPLHFQAPTWRDLLRLLARLSNCRFQASVESMALAKTELKLRTVIQFVRPHHAFPEWRTIVWFTLDYPEPQTKWAPRHPTLPYSYSLSTIPTLLRDVESEMSKVFTVPETNMPFPKLPISFPDLALYLQATLDESRRQSNDSYNGKLAKMVATCFPVQPSDTSSTDPLGSSSRMSRMIKWPWGKGKPGKKGTSSNEETYYLVTPFVAGEHEWG